MVAIGKMQYNTVPFINISANTLAMLSVIGHVRQGLRRYILVIRGDLAPMKVYFKGAFPPPKSNTLTTTPCLMTFRRRPSRPRRDLRERAPAAAGRCRSQSTRDGVSSRGNSWGGSPPLLRLSRTIRAAKTESDRHTTRREPVTMHPQRSLDGTRPQHDPTLVPPPAAGGRRVPCGHPSPRRRRRPRSPSPPPSTTSAVGCD